MIFLRDLLHRLPPSTFHFNDTITVLKFNDGGKLDCNSMIIDALCVVDKQNNLVLINEGNDNVIY